ncbi:hypothetical protein [Segatella maculosa]|uniref:hypothetical protein n=1 Tax=Segatella maculosa TaxID=439703 RepID=UPI0003091654|nr:hypothetical protein [Segatella maculosa]
MAFGCPLTWKKESIYTVAGANARVYWGGRTSRASLHALERLVISAISRIDWAMIGM